MTKRPLVYITGLFCIGVVIFRYINISFIYPFTLACLFMITSIFSFRKNNLVFLVSISVVAVLLGGLKYSSFKILPENHISKFLGNQAKSVYVEGTIVDDPQVSVSHYKVQKQEFTLSAQKLRLKTEWLNVTGLVRVQLFGPSKNYRYADQIILYGNLERPSGPRNPGGFDYRSYLERKKIYVLLVVKQPLDTIYLGSKKGFFLKPLFGLRHRVNSLIDTNLTNLHSKLFSAMITGNRYDIPNNVYDSFIQTGTIHILAISGLHIVIIGFVFLFIFKLLRFPMKFSYVLTMFFLCGYTVFSGARAPVIRAVIMMNVYLIALLIEKEFDVLNTLAVSALIILLFNPLQIFDAGFQLSYLTLFSIIYIGPKIERPLLTTVKIPKHKFYQKIIRIFSVSAAAWIGIIPVVAFYFNIFSPVTVLANLLIIPLMTLTMYVGFCFILSGLIFMPLARLFAQSTWLCLEILIRSVNLFNKLPLGHFYIPKPDIFFILTYFALLLIVLEKRRLKQLSNAKFLIILLFVINIFICKLQIASASNQLTITFLDVNHGDSIFIEFPYRGTLLIDGGERIPPDIDKGKDTVIPFLCKKGFINIDATLNSHPHTDHLGGLVSVLEHLGARYAFDSGLKKLDSGLYKRYLSLINKRRINYKSIKANQRIRGFGDVEILIFNPPGEFIQPATDANNNSLVVKVIYKNFSILLTGDIEEKAMAQLLSYKNYLKADIVKIPHHGSFAGSVEYEFLKAVLPKTAIISIGKIRKGFPDAELMAILNKMNVKTYQTKINGAITISTDGYKYSIETTEGI